MKKLKSLIVLFLTILVSLSLSGISTVKAADGTLSVKVYKGGNERISGLHRMNTGDTNAGHSMTEVFKLISKDGNADPTDEEGYSSSNPNRMTYCLYNGVGLGTGSAASTKYDVYYDLKNDNIPTQHRGRSAELLNDDTRYNELVWVLDNIADPYDNDAVNSLFRDVEEYYGKAEGTFTSQVEALRNDTSRANWYIDAIEVAQQGAIWKYTNFADRSYEPNFKIGVNSYKGILYTGFDNPYEFLYKYLVAKAEYEVLHNGYTRSKADDAEVKIEGLSEDHGVKNGYRLIGYVTIDNVSKLSDITIKTTTKSTDIQESDYTDNTNTGKIKIFNSNEVEVSGNNTLTKIRNLYRTDDKTEKFYIGVQESEEIKHIKITGKSNKNVRTITYWTKKSNTYNTQPIAVIKNTPKTIESELELGVNIPKVDVALRKFITGIERNNQDISSQYDLANRVPKITDTEINALANGEDIFEYSDTPDTTTTAVKKHSKDSLLVEPGDIITYTIRIYNEGDTDVYGIAISDQITSGLEFIQEQPQGETWEYSSTGKFATAVKVSPGTPLIDKFFTNDSGSHNNSLDYTDFTVKCRVKNTADYRTLLKNVAEVVLIRTIDKGYIQDIDSTCNNIKTKYVADIRNYNPPSATEGKGYEDDDDYEIVHVAKPKQYDLALRKYIVSIKDANGTDKYQASDYAARVPNHEDYVEAFANGKSIFATTIEKDHSKEPMVVEKGDKVVYIIRVYNEGEIRGQATEITDYLPEGLDFVEDSTINIHWGWRKDDSDPKKIKIDGTAELNPFNKDTLVCDYYDIEIECVVNENATNDNLRNIAEITADDGDDIDSTPNNVNRTSYSPVDSTRGMGEEDDDDYEDLRLKPTPGFDLALRKYIVSVTSNGVTTNTNRVFDNIDKSKLNVSETTAEYKHAKNAVEAKPGDTVKFRIATFNENQDRGYVYSIKDYLPKYLEFVPESLNSQFTYTFDETTNLLTISKANNGSYLWDLDPFNDTTKAMDSEYVEFECKVKSSYAPSEDTYLTNVATMTYGANPEKNDRDSSGDNFTVPGQDVLVNTNELAYYGNTSNKTYLGDTEYHYKGQEDDDDFEKILVKSSPKFDLALRKFITGVNNEKVTDREPIITQSSLEKLAKGEAKFDDGQTATKTHTKAPFQVRKGYKITYTIRVYNEGDVDGKATEITDYLPEGLSLAKDSEINTKYGWKADSTNPKKVTTDYLANKTIKAFSKEKNREGQYEIFYEDVQIECVINDDITPTTKLRNVAEITEDDNEDRDSTPKDLTDEEIKNYNPGTSEEGKGYEDDDDYEDLCIYDLALRKWVTTAIVIEDNTKKVMYTGHKAEDDPESVVKVEVNEARIKSAVIKFIYSIRITNEGSVDGVCEEITDYIPQGLKFVKEDNPDWTQDSQDTNVIRTEKLKNTTLKPGEAAEVEVALTWINDENNMGVKINTAEISKDDGLDIDSEPNNKKAGEDDIDTAPVALTVVTGSAPLYTSLIAGVLFILGAGIVVIKKVVL